MVLYDNDPPARLRGGFSWLVNFYPGESPIGLVAMPIRLLHSLLQSSRYRSGVTSRRSGGWFVANSSHPCPR